MRGRRRGGRCQREGREAGAAPLSALFRSVRCWLAAPLRAARCLLVRSEQPAAPARHGPTSVRGEGARALPSGGTMAVEEEGLRVFQSVRIKIGEGRGAASALPSLGSLKAGAGLLRRQRRWEMLVAARGWGVLR